MACSTALTERPTLPGLDPGPGPGDDAGSAPG